ncbi:MAG TPA: transcription elongation factor GreA [Candidatus Latescibacteria bacterium]|nr:transcription elongation factor GreA [Candidatus Latescibacterota bacterium]
MNSIYMTREGRAKLEEELRFLKVEERPRIKRQIVEAREKGDLTENAEYDAAKEEQGRLEAKIAKLQDQLSRAIVLDDQSLPEGKAHIGRRVELEDLNTGKRFSYTLVSEAESDFASGKISTGSPVGKGLVGHGAGEEVTVQVPAGTKRFRILRVVSSADVQ